MLAPSVLPPVRTALAVALVSLGGPLHFGFHLVVTNPAQALWAFLVAIIAGGAIFGSFSVRFLAENLGRKGALLFGFALQALALGLAIGSFYLHSFHLFGVSRIILGVAQNLLMSLTSIFLVECSPKYCRGVMGVASGVIQQLGIVLGCLIGLPMVLGTERLWPWIFGSELVALVAVALPFAAFMHETPGHLEARGRSDEAAKAIAFYHGIDDGETEHILHSIREDLQATAEPISMTQVFNDKAARRGTIVGSLANLFFVFAGSGVLVSYSVELLSQAGLPRDQAGFANLGLCAFGLVGSVITMFTVDRLGRRPLFLVTFSVLAVCNIGIVVLIYLSQLAGFGWARFALIGACSLVLLTTALGPSCITTFITAELVGQQAKAAGSAWAFLCFSIGRGSIVATYLPLRNLIGGPLTHLVLFVWPTLLSVPFFYFWLPESKNKTPMEIQKEVAKLPRLTMRIPRGIRSSSPKRQRLDDSSFSVL